jgi:hypothetical protein
VLAAHISWQDGTARSFAEPLDERCEIGQASYAIIGHLFQMFSATAHQPVERKRVTTTAYRDMERFA